MQKQLKHQNLIHANPYRIPYQQCKQHFQKLNYICLNKQCYQHSLICSLCSEQPKHLNHQIRPLKFYIQELQKKYQNSFKNNNNQNQKQGQRMNNESYQSMLDQLEVSQYLFYQKLQTTVNQIAQQFRKLQQQVTQQIQKIRSQILDQISKRNKFNQFYESLKKNNLQTSNFLIQNYLPKSTIGKIGNLNLLEDTQKNICNQIKQIKQKIIYRDDLDSKLSQMKKDKNVNVSLLDFSKLFLKSDNITFADSTLTQTLKNGKNLCLLDYPIKKLIGKILLKIINTKHNSDLYFGIIQKQDFIAMNHMWIYNQKYTSFGTKNISTGWDTANITTIGQGSCIQIISKSGQFILRFKSKENKKKMDENKEYYLYFVLYNQCKIKLTHII